MRAIKNRALWCSAPPLAILEGRVQKRLRDRAGCRVNYGVSFPMLSKLHAGPKTPHPLFRDLAEAAGRYPGWNFHKYLVGRDGQLLADFPSAMDPEAPALEAAVQQALAAPVALQGAPSAGRSGDSPGRRRPRRGAP